MKLRTAVLIGVVGLVAAVIAATVVTLTLVITRSARAQVDDELRRSRAVFRDLVGFQQAQLRARVEQVGSDPKLKAVVNTEDTDRATIEDTASELRGRASVFLLTRANGELRADLNNPGGKGNLLGVPLIQPALENGEASGVWVDDKMAHLVEVQRLMFGERVIGLLVMGRAFDDRLAKQFQIQLGGSVAFLLRGKVIGFATDSTRCGQADCSQAIDRAALAATLTSHTADAHATGTLSLFGADQVTLVGSSAQKKGLLSFAVMRDLDAALAPGKRVTGYVFLVGGVALLAALVFAFAMSGRLSRPLDGLVTFTGDISKGRLTKRAPIRGVSELQTLAQAMNSMVQELEQSRQHMAEKERLAGELQIASRIQTSILPRHTSLPNLSIAARMIPASEVGGDYYDVHPTGDGGWIGIGDVSGHGLDAGLVMLMVQTAVSTFVHAEPDAAPTALLRAVNAVIVDNVRNRLDGDKHMTLSLLRWHDSGKLIVAGAHMDIIWLRKGADACEHLPTPGTWIGIIDDIDDTLVETPISLGDGDLVAVYTDGITEAMNADGAHYGLDRLSAQLIAHRDRELDVIVDRVLADVDDWQAEQADDITLLVMRFHQRG